MVVCQVTDGQSMYEVKDEAGSIRTVHPAGDAMPLGVGVLL